MSFDASFPTLRLRRLRSSPALRRLVQTTRLSPAEMILPLFVREGSSGRLPISSMPPHAQLSVEEAVKEAEEAKALGLGGVLLFGIPAHKDDVGSSACEHDGVVQDSIRAIKRVVPELLVVTDVCFCEYTDHGHCGPLMARGGTRDVDNDRTLPLLAEQAVSHAAAGADIVAPSGMMDGMIAAIRKGLDTAGFSHTPILSYAAKYASAFYGPFREAAESTPQFGDRRTYQMDPAAAPAQALRECALDLAEGADMLMVKPALAYLDIIAAVAQAHPGVPLVAYNVSGEYSMVKAAAERGWIDEQRTALEMLTAIKRAGATIQITYWAKDVAQWVN